ncbi:MAG: GatB/YqeY domain-containing protein [Gammaproteobacteria bacterium]|nr:GatB/YqeY domain-containing protein [Gammaproteobacteria bacterium]
MSLKQTIQTSIKEAMKAKSMAELATLRFLSAAVKQKEVDERIELDDAQIIAIIEKQIKQHKESIDAFTKAGRTESAEKEAFELTVLQRFLPEQASEEEVIKTVTDIINDLKSQGIQGMAAMGPAVKAAKAKLAGRTDVGQLAQRIKSML